MKNLSFKSSNVFCYSSFHSKENSFLRRSKSGFTNWEKPFINFRQKLIRPKKDQIPLTMTGLFQSFITSNFLRSSLTPSMTTCLRKSISFGQTHFSPCWQIVGFLGAYLTYILSALHHPSLFWSTPIYHQYRDHELIQLFVENIVHEGGEHQQGIKHNLNGITKNS